MTLAPQPIAVTRTAEFDVPIDAVWTAITDPSALRDWLADDVELDLRPGGVGALHLPDGDRSVLVTAVDPGRRLSMLWWGETVSAVEMTLTESESGTEMVVVERLLVPADQVDAARVSMQMRWGCAFALLSTVCSPEGAQLERAQVGRAGQLPSERESASEGAGDARQPLGVAAAPVIPVVARR